MVNAVSQAFDRAVFVEVGNLLVTKETANRTMHFHEASPPHYGSESPQVGLRMTARRFVNT